MNNEDYKQVDLRSLALHEVAFVNCLVMILTVPGGYIYEYYDEETNGIVSTVFVPRTLADEGVKVWVRKDKDESK